MKITPTTAAKVTRTVARTSVLSISAPSISSTGIATLGFSVDFHKKLLQE